MPHFSIDQSGILERLVDMTGFCHPRRRAGIETGVFPMTGIGVRAYRADHWSLADGGADAMFIDISARLREGRPLQVRQAATQTIFDAAQACLQPLIDTQPVALSMEMREVNADLGPKPNTIPDHRKV